MNTKTLILAAAAVLTIGVGSAFAEGDGNGFNDYLPRPAVTQPNAGQQHIGQSAGDHTAHVPAWADRNGTGGGN